MIEYFIKWFKKLLCYMDWHKPILYGFDGCSATGKCSRCDERLLLSSQGWFGIERDKEKWKVIR